MSVALVVITDGRRHCIDKTIPSALAALHGPITTKLIYDDSGDPENRDWLQHQFGDEFFVIAHPDGRQGFGGAIRFVWRFLATAIDEPYVFWLEDDFLFNRPVDLDAMAALLDAEPHLVQLVLKRQPWNDEEKAAGGIVESHPADYDEVVAVDADTGALVRRLEHRRFWSTNPHLMRRSLCCDGWPDVEHSEGMFTHHLLADPDLRFAFMGGRTDEPWVHHIGHQRVGVGY